MIMIDAIPVAEDSYEFLCIHDLTCDPHEADTHSRACHAINDVERAHFYREALVAEVAVRTTMLANSAGLVVLDWQRDVLVHLWREHFSGDTIADEVVRRAARPGAGCSADSEH